MLSKVWVHGFHYRCAPSAPGCVPPTAGINRRAPLAPGRVPLMAGVHCFAIGCAALSSCVFLFSALQCCQCLIATVSTCCIQLMFYWNLLLPLRTQSWRFCVQSQKGSAIGLIPVPLGSKLFGDLEGLGIILIWRLTGKSTLSVRPWTPTWALMNSSWMKIL